MASIAKNVALSFGLITASVNVEAALESKAKTGNVTVCDHGHEPSRIRQPRICDACAIKNDDMGEVPYQQLKKARPVEGGFVVLTDEDIAEASQDVTKFKKKAAVTAHPAEQVGLLSSTGDKMYYLVPDKGHESAYATLMALVVAHPELAFVTQWTPRSALAQFQLAAHDGALVFQERTAGSSLKPAPSLDLEFDSGLIALAEQVLALPASVSDYDPETYRDTFDERIAAIVEKREVVMVDKTTMAPVAPVTDLMAKLQAHLAEAAPKPKRRAPARKKVSA